MLRSGPNGIRVIPAIAGHELPCMVVAPSLIPVRQGDRVKTDRRDALRLAQLFRAGELVPVFVPSEDNASLRDLVWAREDGIEDRLRARHRLSKFLVRHDRRPKSRLLPWGVHAQTLARRAEMGRSARTSCISRVLAPPR